MKYIYWLIITIWIPIRKVIGLVWFWLVVPFRKYARNVVYNYVLQNGIYLKRLLERPLNGRVPGHIKVNGEMIFGYTISPYHRTGGGYIEYRKVSAIEYHLVFWLIWGWLDDDSNNDTWDKNYTQSIIDPEHKDARMQWMPEFFKNILRKEITGSDVVYGNSFDLGDKRAEVTKLAPLSTLLWVVRNTAYNFAYMQNTTNDKSLVFNIKFWNMEFGWEDKGDGEYKHITGVNF